MTQPTAADERRVLEGLLYRFEGEMEALWHVVREAREADRGHVFTLGAYDLSIAAMGLADNPERVTALRNRIQELRDIEENQ